METTQQHNNKNNGYSSLEEFTLRYLSKKNVARFSEFFEWLQTAMANPPVKSAVSTNLDRMADDGKIFSWNKKGARYIASVKEFDEIKNEVFEFINKKWIETDKIKFDEIEENLNYPPKLIHNALVTLVSEGKILNRTIDNVTYYRLPPIHHSITIGIPILAFFLSIYLFFGEYMPKYVLFAVSLVFLIVMLVLWNRSI